MLSAPHEPCSGAEPDRGDQQLARIDGRLQLVAPKTASSRRTVQMPPAVTLALRAYKDAQHQERPGNHWIGRGLVFTTTIGTPIDPRNAIRD